MCPVEADEPGRVVPRAEALSAEPSGPTTPRDPIGPRGLITPAGPVEPDEPDDPIAPMNPIKPLALMSRVWRHESEPLDRARTPIPQKPASWSREQLGRVAESLPRLSKLGATTFRKQAPVVAQAGSSSAEVGVPRPGLRRAIPVVLGTAVLIALLDHGHHPTPHPVTPPIRPPVPQSSVRPSTPATPHVLPNPSAPSSLAGVTMPNTGGGSLPLHPLRLLLSVDNPTSVPRVDLHMLGSWIASHERRGSIMRLSIGRGGRKLLSVPLAPAELVGAPSTLAGTARQAQRWLAAGTHTGAQRPVRLMIDIGVDPTVPRLGTAARKTIRLEFGTPVPSASAADPRRHDSIAAAVALQIIQATGQSERESPHLR